MELQEPNNTAGETEERFCWGVFRDLHSVISVSRTVTNNERKIHCTQGIFFNIF